VRSSHAYDDPLKAIRQRARASDADLVVLAGDRPDETGTPVTADLARRAAEVAGCPVFFLPAPLESFP
jgi:nucleotide-binding universal stress UspA family protein